MVLVGESARCGEAGNRKAEKSIQSGGRDCFRDPKKAEEDGGFEAGPFRRTFFPCFEGRSK